MYKTIEEIKKDYDNKKYSIPYPEAKKLPDTHVFDPDMTVRENQEMVRMHNQSIEDARKNAFRVNAELSRKLTQDIVTYIMNTYKMNEKQAQKVHDYVYEHYHSCMHDFFIYIDEVAQMVEDIFEMK